LLMEVKKVADGVFEVTNCEFVGFIKDKLCIILFFL
jgi:hypothetical protein